MTVPVSFANLDVKFKAWLKGSRPEVHVDVMNERFRAYHGWITSFETIQRKNPTDFLLLYHFFPPNICRHYRRVGSGTYFSVPAGVVLQSFLVGWDFCPHRSDRPWGEMADRSMRALKDRSRVFFFWSTDLRLEEFHVFLSKMIKPQNSDGRRFSFSFFLV